MFETAFTLLGSAVTWLEVWAFSLAVVGIACNIGLIHWGWPLAALSALLYFGLFMQAKLYADGVLQLFFAATSLWGWWQWLYGKRDTAPLAVTRASVRTMQLCVLAWLMGWGVLGWLLARFSDTDVPYFDAFPTVGSLIAQLLLARKVLQNWLLWIVVNLVAIALFSYKELYLTALLYLILTCIAIAGLARWTQQLKPLLPPQPPLA
jgi:nicotinamide mononucleotide transporter